MHRREFLAAAVTLSAVTPLTAARRELAVTGIQGNVQKETGDAAVWYTASSEGDGLVCVFPAGTLADARYITADMLIEGDLLAVFDILLREGVQGRQFRCTFAGLNQCSFRIRLNLEMVNQNRWMADREGAFLKPMAGGDRVDLDKVDRLIFVLKRKGPDPVRWSLTPFAASSADVPKLDKPSLPKGPLLDAFGQYTLRDWPSKTRSEVELTGRIQRQAAAARSIEWPETFSRWGGWKSLRFGDGSGFFRTRHDGKRWWLVDPDGYAFWSAGLDCVRVDTDARYDGIAAALAWKPDPKGQYAAAYRDVRGEGRTINYLAANLIRSFGRDEWRARWAAIALAEMKRLRFNTVGNWSDWEIARAARFPYVRPMAFTGRRCGLIYRDFPDVFHPEFSRDAAEYAAQLKSTADDPAFIGYFLMNEPTWGFSSETPAAGMLYTTEACASRNELVRRLKTKYADDAALSSAWGQPATFERLARGKWDGALGTTAKADLAEFSSRMVETYFNGLSTACRAVDPKHLNLGMRWAGVPPDWAVAGMKSFDVFSLNCYQENLPRDTTEKIQAKLNMPVMVGEWHFGALDVGLPASGIGRLKNQADRAAAYRNYLEDAAANPHCVGVHWFTMYDESALGRFDGENYNIGFFDVCNRPYEEMGRAAVASHERMYSVAAGQSEPFAQHLQYLPKLFL
ncbi:MAG: hypothetical protein JSU00_20695 [Acidobacteria bacterium]|nr:hypothetical protein [Acidobacteriota bacterium]